jgi:hypothetical protein
MLTSTLIKSAFSKKVIPKYDSTKFADTSPAAHVTTKKSTNNPGEK